MSSELKRVVRLTSFDEEERTRPALRYWLSRPLHARECLDFIRSWPGRAALVPPLSATANAGNATP